LQKLDFPSHPKQLTIVDLNDNNFPKQGLVMFSKLVNLEKLYLGNYSVYLRDDKRIQEKINQGFYNQFTGSLEPLKNLTKLEYLDIRNTDLDHGLEYLPGSVKNFCCSAKEMPQAKCQVLTNLLVNEQGIVETTE
jgi:Leucine-rich repeat (LRR) protein